MPENDITELQTLDIYQLTEEQYNDLVSSSELDPNAIYMTPASAEGKFTTCTLPIFSTAGSQAVTVSGVTANSNPVLDVYIASASDVSTMTEAWSHIYRADTSADTITFYSDDATSTALTVMVKDY